MKRTICFLLILCLLLSGCSVIGERLKEPVTFYYLCSEYQEKLCCVITSEEREASGHSQDLSYLLQLYLMGPVSDECRLPLRAGTQIQNITMKEARIEIQLSDTASTLSDIDFSLACACLTLTCLDVTDAESVTLKCGSRASTMSRDTLTLYDTIAATDPTEVSQ